jgi:hypothetical protein
MAYMADIGLLYRALTFQVSGTLEKVIDSTSGRYEVRALGQGPGVSNRLEAQGRLIGRRWAPLRSASWLEVAGRSTRTEVHYDYERGIIDYHYRGETFLLRRQRVADDVLAIPRGLHIDDLTSAFLNFSEGRWPVASDGTYRTHVVRRQRPHNEGPDDVSGPYRAELAAVAFKVDPGSGTEGRTVLLDISGFTGWARKERPARILLGHDWSPTTITASLILGTSVTIRLGRLT